MDLHEMNGQELMKRVKNDSDEAYNVLVKRWRDPLTNYLSGFVNNREKARDLAQEALIRVYENRESYEPVAKFSTWLYTIGKNLALSAKRKQERKTSLTIQKDDKEEFKRSIEQSTEKSPDENLQADLTNDYIHKALDQIPNKFSRLVKLCDVEQKTYDQIQEITGLPSGTVKSRIARGRKKIQKKLESFLDPSE